MKFLLNHFTHTTLLFTLTAMLLITGCSNPASSDDDHHDHEEQHAVGAVLQDADNNELVRIEEGKVIAGSLSVNSGQETPLITIYFLDEDGDLFQPEDNHFELRWDQIDTAVADIKQNNENGTWSFYLTGISQGETEVRFRMWYPDADHSDFDTPAIPITVN